MIAQLAAGAVLAVVVPYAVVIWLARHCDLIWLARRVTLRAPVRVVEGRVIRSPRRVARSGRAAIVTRRVVAGEIEGERIER